MSQARGFVRAFALACGGLWVWAAIAPVDRRAWALENLLLVLFAVALFLVRKRLAFSSAASVFILAFFVLHIIGAHYTYAQMPLGLWTKRFLHLSRNPYDRVAHFAFGLLLAFPGRELLLKFGGVRPGAASWLAVTLILAASGVFEILESIVAEMIAPGAGVVWLGGQGDPWDAQNDMLMALLGASATMAIVAVRERAKKSRV